MRIQHAADATGLTPETIRFYERRGVLPPPARQANGYRDYTEDHGSYAGQFHFFSGGRRCKTPLPHCVNNSRAKEVFNLLADKARSP